jgi:hypothetical protein
MLIFAEVFLVKGGKSTKGDGNMTTQIALRQKTLSVGLIIAGLMAFATLLIMSGMMGHLAGLFGLSYAQAREIILAAVNNYINSLPFWEQLIAKAEYGLILYFYHLWGLQPVIAW